MSQRRCNLPQFILSGSAAALLSLTSSAFAVEDLWTGGGANADWNNPANWSLGRVPSSANGQPAGDTFDDAVINTLTNFPVISADLTASPHDVIVGRASGSVGRVDHRVGNAATSTGTATTAGSMFIGRDGGTGTYNLANTAATGGTLTSFGLGTGSLNLNGLLYVGGFSGVAPGSVGTFNLNTTGSLTIGGDLNIGSAGSAGTMNVDSGTVTTGGWNFFGKNEGTSGSNGRFRMSGGTVTNNGARTFIGLGDSTGSMEMRGGTYNNMLIGSDTFFAIGVNNLDATVTPALNMTGGTINSARVFTIGGTEAFGGNGDFNFVGSGKGAATVNGATARINSFGEFWVGQGGGSVGDLTLTAGTIAVDNWIDIGRFGATGRVSVTGGTLIKSGAGHFLIGDGPGANGSLTQSGGTIAINNGELWVGQSNSTGLLEMSGGTLSVNNWTAIGRNAGNGTMNLTGGTFNKTGGGVFIVADPTGNASGATGVVNQSGASVLNTNEIWVGQGVAGNGTYNTSAGTMTSTGWIAVGREQGLGVLNVSGTGLIEKTGTNGSHLIIGSLGGNGTVNQTGGTVRTNPGSGSIFMGENRTVAGVTFPAQTLWDLSGGVVQTDEFVVSWNGGTNELRVRGTGALTGGHIDVGRAGGGGKGVVNQTGGTINSNTWIAVGIGSSQQAEYNLSGGTSNAAGFEVGADTQGIVRVSGTGILNVSGNIEAPSRNGTGIFEITGGTVNTNNFFQGGRDNESSLGSGVTNQSGGTVNVTGDLAVQRVGPGVGVGTYNLTGGTLAVNGSIQGTVGTFNFAGGKITRSNAGTITYNGDLTTAAAAATFGLNADKTFQINGALNNTAGLSLDLSGLGIPDQPSPLFSPVTGTFALGTISTVPGPGAFNTGRTFDLGFDATFTTGGPSSFTATRINEDAPFNPLTQSVYWLDEDAGVVSLQYSVIPEPGSAALLSLAGLMLLGRRRRH